MYVCMNLHEIMSPQSSDYVSEDDGVVIIPYIGCYQ